MEKDEQTRIDELNRQAAREKAPDDPHATRPRDTKPLIIISLAGLVIAVLLLGVMWLNNPRYDGTSPEPIAERSDSPAQPARQ